MKQSINEQFYILKHTKSDTKPTRLIILIHGYGSNEEDLYSLADEFPDYFLVVSLRGLYQLPLGGYAWYAIDFLNNEKFTNIEEAKFSIEKINQFVDELAKKYTFEVNDIWLCGFSQGAILSYALGLQFPERYKKLICLSGYIDENMLSNDLDNKDHSDLNIFISHGTEDVVIPIDWSRRTCKFLEQNNINFSYQEYLAGHGINPDNYRDMMFWILKNGL